MNSKKIFLYTELQLAVPFTEVPWQSLNTELKKQKGLLKKTWLSGVQTNTVGGFYEFDSIESAKAFAEDYFPREAKNFGATFTIKLFDGDVVEEASREMGSPYYN